MRDWAKRCGFIWLRRHFQLLLILFVLSLSSTTRLCADGIYIPHKAYLTSPKIPAQMAVISYRDGKETLVVQSQLEAEGQEFGWIIPVPAVPTEMRVGTPGILKTFAVELLPEMYVSDPHTGENGFKLFLIFLTISYWCLTVIYRRPNFRLARNIFASVFLFVFLCFCSLQSLGSKALVFNRISGISILNEQSIGNYDVAVLQPKSSTAFNDWLNANNLRPLDARGQKIVQQYLDEGWSFVAAKLHRDTNGLSAPHPLILTFPAKQPVYPMRLTALADSPVHLELFVIAKEQVKTSPLRLAYCDQFSEHKLEKGQAWLMDFTSYGASSSTDRKFFGKSYKARIGHDKAMELMWEGCVVTKLSGDLLPKDMALDYVLNSVEHGAPRRDLFYSSGRAFFDSVFWSMGLWCVGLIALVVYYRKIIYAQTHKVFIDRAIKLLMLACWLTTIVIYVALPKADIRDAGSHGSSLYQNSSHVSELAEEFLTIDPPLSKEVLSRKLQDTWKELDLQNPYQGEDRISEDSPGNFEVAGEGKDLAVRLYLEDGSYEEIKRSDVLKQQSR